MTSKNQEKSPAWEYFEKISGSKNVKCRECKQVLQRTDGSTTSMMRHLQNVHGLLKEIEPKSATKVNIKNYY
jgi:hypothetical protein